MNTKYLPPFNITPLILRLSSNIYKKIGLFEGQQLSIPSINLRKQNKIKIIQASLAIEGNTLSIEQITAIMEGKKIVGPTKDILEVKNALKIYDDLKNINPLKIKDLLKAHQVLMEGLVKENGKFRSTNVGIFQGNNLSHMAPSAKMVPQLIENLFNFLNTSDLPWLMKSCIFHYEFEYIHPFEDGNGRMGRLWQQLILIKENPIFEFVTIEEIVKTNQREYYDALSSSDKSGDSTKFIEFSLATILDALLKYNNFFTPFKKDAQSRLDYTKYHLTNWFDRREYISINHISAATASRDLIFGLNNNILESQGSKNQTKYRFKE